MSENNGYPAAFIDDGYTRDGFIEGDTNYHPPLRFEYRPTLRPEAQKVYAAIDHAVRGDPKNADSGVKVAAEHVAKQLVSWELKTRDGDEVKISPENVAKVETHLQAKLVSIVMGEKASDDEGDAKN